MKENQIRQQAIIQSLAEVLYQVDINGLLVYVNPNGARMLGYEGVEIIGKSMHEVVHAGTYPAKDCSILNVIRDGDSQNREDRFRRKDGSFIPVQLLSAPLVMDWTDQRCCCFLLRHYCS